MRLPQSLLIVGCVTAFAHPAWSESKLATVVGSSASMRQHSQDAWSTIGSGETAPMPADLRAGDDPVTLALANGAKLTLAPHAEVRLLGALDVSARAGEKTRATSVRLDSGSAGFIGPSASGSSVLLSHGDSSFALVFAGSEGEIRLADSVLYAALAKGRMQVASKGAFSDLAAGHLTAVAPGALVVSLPDSPVLGQKDALSLVTDKGLSRSGPLSWSSTSDGNDYLVEVARDKTFADLVSTQRVDAPHAELPVLSPGAYFARVVGVGAGGFLGTPSAVIPLRVLQAQLPTGAHVDADGKWLLPPSAEIEIPSPEGLELAMDRGGFFRAPKSFHLPSNDSHTVRFRLVGGSSQLSLVASADPTHANITIGPATAVWPRDPVTVAARIVNRPGGADALRPKMTVTVNGREVATTFAEHHGEWRATIAPMHTKGPWIMRVAASDPEGHPIGWSFLEIASE